MRRGGQVTEESFDARKCFVNEAVGVYMSTRYVQRDDRTLAPRRSSSSPLLRFTLGMYGMYIHVKKGLCIVQWTSLVLNPRGMTNNHRKPRHVRLHSDTPPLVSLSEAGWAITPFTRPRWQTRRWQSYRSAPGWTKSTRPGRPWPRAASPGSCGRRLSRPRR